jgi:hypothetical protein
MYSENDDDDDDDDDEDSSDHNRSPVRDMYINSPFLRYLLQA